jgi:hypothetical protein
MNDINSLIIEGVVSKGFKAISSNEGEFTLTSKRTTKVGDNCFEEELTDVVVIVHGTLFKYAQKYLDEDRGVRVVGRLCNINGGVQVIAEHFEVKSKTKNIDGRNFVQD